MLFDFQYQQLSRTQGCIPDTDGGVVSPDNVSLKQIAELCRTWPDFILENNMERGINKTHVFFQPLCSGSFSNFGYRDADPTIIKSSPVAKNDFHRLQHRAPSRFHRASSGNQQALVDVMMQDAPGHGKVLPAEADTDRLHDRVADGIGMPGSLALDQFDSLHADRSTSGLFDNNVSCCNHKRPHPTI